MEAVIVAGLKRPADRTAGAGAQADLGAATPKLADAGIAVAAAARAWFGRIQDWAIRRALTPNSLIGISLLFAFCAAAWFSGGTGNDITPGILALCGWLLAWVSAGRLAAITGPRTGGSRRPATTTAVSWSSVGRSAVGRSAACRSAVSRFVIPRSVSPRPARCGATSGSTDWLALPGVIWDDGSVSVPPAPDQPSDPDLAHEPAARSGAWSLAVAAVVAECAIYGGIAAGGQSDGWTGMWPLAVMAIIAVAIRQTIGSCCGLRSESALGSGPWSRQNVLNGRKTGMILSPPVGARVALVAAALAVHGPRVALFAVLAVEVASICHAVVVTRGPARAGASTRADHPPLVSGLARRGQPAPPVAVPSRPDVVLVSRDDGAAARWAGRLVQGNLIPLPAALAGVAAAVMLAALGLANLPGVIAFTPPAVMMLAAPGSGHPHDGRLDWLVPAVLQVGQYVYLAALGFAWAVPGPVVYSLCALTAAWYANRVADSAGTLAMLRRERDEASPPTACAGTPIGWEGRMFAVTLGAMLGMATFVYLAVAAYLGLLIGRKVVIGYLLPGEDGRR
jgi:hypothetical protein